MKRLVLILVFVGVLAGVVAASASALAFEDTPCVPNAADTRICPSGTTGTPYSLQITGRPGTGCVPYVTFKVVGGALPSGLSLSSSGLISGTPTGAGIAQFWIEMRDIPASEGGPSWCSVPKAAQRLFQITIEQGLTITTGGAPVGTVGTAYSLALTATSAGTWSVTAGALPDGLSLNPSTGAIGGTPTKAGTFTFTAQVSNGSKSSSKQFQIVVREALAIAAVKAPKMEVGVELKKPLVIAATGGADPKTVKVEGLPTGLTFDAATGAISGTPTAAGSFTAKVSVSDPEGRTATLDVPLTVAAELKIATKKLPVAKVGKPFEATLEALEGTGIGPIKWKVTSGKFPTGLHLTPWEGTISGTPRQAGVFHVTIEATDAKGVTAEVDLTITVKKAKKAKKA